MADNSQHRDMIAFWIGNEEYCIPVTSIREIRSWTPTTPLPHAPSFMLGVVNLRGIVLPIVDLAARFGYAPTVPTPRHAIMIAEAGGEIVGLLVDGVSGIMPVTNDQVQPAPPIAVEGGSEFIEGILSRDDRIVSLVSLRCLLPQALQIAA